MNGELAQLRAEAEADNVAPPRPGAPSAAEGAKEWAGAIEFALNFAKVPFPELANVYTPDKVKELSEALQGVGAKYGWTMSSLFLRFEPEIKLAMVAVPLLIATGKVLNAKKAPPAAAAAAKGGAPNLSVVGSQPAAAATESPDELKPNT